MGFWADLGNFVSSCIFFVGNVITDTALTVSQYIQRAAGATVVPNHQRQRIDIQRELHDINRQLQYFLQKWAHDGRRSKRDNDRYRELVEKRNNEKEKLWKIKEAEVANEVRNNRDKVNSTIITSDKPHIIQYHIGQITKDKKCPNCGRSMVLNFPRDRDLTNANEFLWTCVSYYFGTPCPTVPYTHADSNLFANERVEEFKSTNEDLKTIFEKTQGNVIGRIDEYRNQRVGSYLCPIHGTELVLRKKNQNVRGALDQYFLACSYYNHARPNALDSCRYIVKLKSPAQLAAALRRFEGRGIL